MSVNSFTSERVATVRRFAERVRQASDRGQVELHVTLPQCLELVTAFRDERAENRRLRELLLKASEASS